MNWTYSCHILSDAIINFPVGSRSIKESACSAGDTRHLGSIPESGTFPGEGNGNPFQLFTLGKSHEQRRLEGYSLLGLKESDRCMTKQMHALRFRLSRHFSQLLSRIGNIFLIWLLGYPTACMYGPPGSVFMALACECRDTSHGYSPVISLSFLFSS